MKLSNHSKTIIYIGICSIAIMLTNLGNTIAIKKSIEERELILKVINVKEESEIYGNE